MSDEALDDLVKQIRGMTAGTRYYVPADEVRPAGERPEGLRLRA